MPQGDDSITLTYALIGQARQEGFGFSRAHL
jgi:hypothetical protein